MRGGKDNRERTEDCESNQTASDFPVTPFAPTQRVVLSLERAI